MHWVTSALIGLLWLFPGVAQGEPEYEPGADWFRCWPDGGDTRSHEPLTSVRVLGLQIGIPGDWKREVPGNRFREEFSGKGGSSITVTRQRTLTDEDRLLRKMERRELGPAWQSPQCREELRKRVSFLPEVVVSSYRSVIYSRGWKTTAILMFRDGEDWITIRFQQRWKKWKKRMASDLVMEVFTSVRDSDAEGLAMALSLEEHAR